MLDDYLERRLPPNDQEKFEEHYFSCSACLEEVQARQTLTAVLREGQPGREHLPGRPGEQPGPVSSLRRWVAPSAAAAALAVVALGLFMLARSDIGPGMQEREPVRLRLEGTYRGTGESTNRAPAAVPLELELSVLVPRVGTVRYDVAITGPHGREVFRADGVRPASDTHIAVSVPEGLPRPGTHTVRVTERRNGEGEELTFRYSLEVVPGDSPD